MEYDPLSDLYDLEYTHDYDLPFWLSLAAREAGPLIEWGAGTGRIAVPLSTAGHEVTAVELSVPMVEQGKPKTESVEWIVGDMRDVDTGRRYGLAVCAFNSFLCLKSVDQALALLQSWNVEESSERDEQRETWKFLKQALDEDRLSDRKLFP